MRAVRAATSARSVCSSSCGVAMRVNYRIDVSLEKDYFGADLSNVIWCFLTISAARQTSGRKPSGAKRADWQPCPVPTGYAGSDKDLFFWLDWRARVEIRQKSFAWVGADGGFPTAGRDLSGSGYGTACTGFW